MRRLEDHGGGWGGVGVGQSQSLRIDEAWTAVWIVCKSRREEGGEAAASTYLLYACALRTREEYRAESAGWYGLIMRWCSNAVEDSRRAVDGRWGWSVHECGCRNLSSITEIHSLDYSSNQPSVHLSIHPINQSSTGLVVARARRCSLAATCAVVAREGAAERSREIERECVCEYSSLQDAQQAELQLC
jgi:hypothetical protein